jgi:hypothetical protein
MLRKITVLMLAAAICGPAAAQEMEPGEWQFTSSASSPMFPNAQSSTITHCIKKEDAGDPQRWMGKPPDSDCKMTLGPRSGEGQSFEFSCPKSNMRGTGTIRYGRGTVESDLQMAGDMQGQKFEIRTKTSGKRLGPCKS